MHLKHLRHTALWGLCSITLISLPARALAKPPAPPDRLTLSASLKKWTTPEGARLLQGSQRGETAEVPVPFRCTAYPEAQNLQLEDLQILTQSCTADGKKCQYQVRLGLVQAQQEQHCQETYALQLILAPGKKVEGNTLVTSPEAFWQVVAAHSFSSYRYHLKPYHPLDAAAQAELPVLLQQRLQQAAVSAGPFQNGNAGSLMLNLPFPAQLPAPLMQYLGQPGAVEFRVSADRQHWQATGLNKSHLQEVRYKLQTAGAPPAQAALFAPLPADKQKGVLELMFSPAGKTLLAQVIQSHQGQYFGLFVDGELVSAPYIYGLIPAGGALIENLEPAQAQKLAILMRFPTLPASLQLSGPELVEEPAP